MVYYKVKVYAQDSCVGITPKCPTPMMAARCAFYTIIYPLECKVPVNKSYLDGVGVNAEECFDFLKNLHDWSTFDDFRNSMKCHYDEGVPPTISDVELLIYFESSEEVRWITTQHRQRSASV